MTDFELFPGFKTPPNDPSREMRWKREGLTKQASPEDIEYQDMSDLSDDDDQDEWCDLCQNMGIIDCHCGGDLCVCDNYGEMPCPRCGF